MKRKSFNIFISILLILISYGFIIYKILDFQELKEFSSRFQNYTLHKLLFLSLAISLMFFNWFIETYKWKILMDKIQKISFYTAIKAVFTGITLGIFTPNRVGEIGGRVLFIEKGNRTYSIMVTSIGSFAQFLTTLIYGLSGIIIFLSF